MIGILLAKFKTFIRSPWSFVVFTGMSMVFALIFGGTSMDKAYIPVYTDDELLRESYIGEELEKQDAFGFNWVTKDELQKQISTGMAEVGVILKDEEYQVIVGVDSYNVNLVQQIVSSIYKEKIEREQIAEAANLSSETEKKSFLEEMDFALENPVFKIKSESFRGEDAFVYDNSLHRLFGFSLFFVIYTIAYNVLPILVEKRDGIWDRMILSPLKKWEMYVANLVYSFITGFAQVIIIFLMFRYVIGVDFHGKFIETLLLLMPYVFSIVSLAILLTAVVKTVQQFNAALPILAVSMAMIGGAYWPIELVESKFLLTLAKFNPLTYGMEILNGAAVYGHSLEELLVPISILLLMGVIMMGLGIHLMERRHV
ncbi:ABC transporter permease [Ornithinibacillus xuwenensis]|uniref:ABC transporter permease n=1 Tax=Ornithinibacillus xuwenensis TaxID=3144668 RepID=A0ABU9XL36_9BACI